MSTHIEGNEEKLMGGNMNEVARAGDTVRRPAGAWTETIHRLLRHVRARGIDWVPEPRGLDGDGREIVSFLPGVVPSYPLTRWVWSDALLANAAARLRAFHDATVGFSVEDLIWQIPTHEPIEVICHNDFAPYNFVCVDEQLSGVIDFDTASPGPRIWDVAYLAYRLCPLASESNDDARMDGVTFTLQEQERRLNLLLANYRAAFSAGETIDTAIVRLEDLARFSEQRAQATGNDKLLDHANLYRADAADLRRRRT